MTLLTKRICCFMCFMITFIVAYGVSCEWSFQGGIEGYKALETASSIAIDGVEIPMIYQAVGRREIRRFRYRGLAREITYVSESPEEDWKQYVELLLAKGFSISQEGNDDNPNADLAYMLKMELDMNPGAIRVGCKKAKQGYTILIEQDKGF